MRSRWENAFSRRSWKWFLGMTGKSTRREIRFWRALGVFRRVDATCDPVVAMASGPALD